MRTHLRDAHSLRQFGVKLPAAALALFFLASSAALKAELRTWTDTSGRYQIQAEFVDFDEGQVKLRKHDGSVITLPLAKLCRPDQTYVQEIQQHGRHEDELRPDPKEIAKQAYEYQRLLLECSKLAAATTDEIARASEDAAKTLVSVTRTLEKHSSAPTVPDNNSPFLAIGNGRWVEREHMGELYVRLGMLKVRSAEALREIQRDYQKLRQEHLSAKQAAQRARYWEAVSRAMALQRAVNETRAIRSGAMRVVVGPHKSSAGPVGTAMYVNQLWEYAGRRAPSIFIKPRRPTTSGIFEAKDWQRRVEQLDEAVSKELTTLEIAWFPEVEKIIGSGNGMQCSMALETLGWWSGNKGKKLFEKALASDDPKLREAAAGAVGSFVKTEEDLIKYLSHSRPESRLAAIMFLKAEADVDRLDETPAKRLARIAAIATTDERAEIRHSAYEALDVLLAENHPWKVAVGPNSVKVGNPQIPREKLDSHWANMIEVDKPPAGLQWVVVELFKKEYGQCLIPALKKAQSEVVLDALSQIACRKCKWGMGLAVHFSLGADIRRLCRSRDERIRVKALTILPWVDWKEEYAPVRQTVQ